MVKDIFVVAGQSNARGQGTSSGSPDVTSTVAQEYKSTTDELVVLDDPVGQDNTPEQAANTGSLWPSFAETYNDESGREAIYVPYSNGGSGQHPDTYSDPDNGWGSDGNLYYNARDKLQEATTFFDNNSIDYTLQGVVWLQGERDAGQIDDGVITKSQYKTAFNDHIDRWQNDIASDFAFYIIQIGHLDSGDTQGFMDVRAAQQEVADSRANVHMVSTIQKDFPEEGKMSDTFHYTQDGYNESGTVSATNTASITTNTTASGDGVIATQNGVISTTNGVVQTVQGDETAPTITNFAVQQTVGDTTAPTISGFSVRQTTEDDTTEPSVSNFTVSQTKEDTTAPTINNFTVTT